jgi:GxxExxY protein
MNQITENIIKAAITVHRELGPGLLESVYQRCMCIELKHMGVAYRAEVPVPVKYRGVDVHPEGFRADLIVEEAVIVEFKSVANLMDIHKKQLLTYLRLCNLTLGLLINFNETKLVDGLVRVANRYGD